MKYILLTGLAACLSTAVSAQSILTKDIDKDKLIDTVEYDPAASIIICKLSTLKYDPIMSHALVTFSDSVGIVDHKEGFEFFIQWQYSSAHVAFQYNKRKKRMQTFSIQRKDHGDALTSNHNGASVLHIDKDEYTGSWEYWDADSTKLVPYPAIKQKWKYGTVDLENFEISYITDYINDCKIRLAAYADKFHQKRLKVKK